MALLLVIAGVVEHRALSGALTAVERQRAQVANVTRRRAETLAGVASMPPGQDREAELAGAENRVAVERRRYDEVVVGYSAAVASFPGAWVASLSALPDRLPLSNDVHAWWRWLRAQAGQSGRCSHR